MMERHVFHMWSSDLEQTIPGSPDSDEDDLVTAGTRADEPETDFLFRDSYIEDRDLGTAGP
jgi:hypothetical protein